MRLFVYGILRPTYNDRRFQFWKRHEPATVTGGLYHISSRECMYPVAKFDEEGTIFGDLLDCPPSRQLESVISMEAGAGYELRDVKATLESGETVDARAFHFRFIPPGPRIESGDWLKAWYEWDD